MTLALFACRAAPDAPAHARSDGGGAAPSKAYDFTSDWFSAHIETWTRLLEPMKGKPGLRYLEIGVWEGRSLLWVLDNVLTHPTSRATAIDLAVPERLWSNLDKSGRRQDVTLIRGMSRQELPKLPRASFDLIYVDGSHTADDVLADAVMAWELLKPGGLIIFDDYRWDGSFHTGGAPLPAELTPRPAIDAFILAYQYEAEKVASGDQVVLRKAGNPCDVSIKPHCTPLGPYVYNWHDRRLYRPHDPARVELTAQETAALEAMLRSSRRDAVARDAPAFVARLRGVRGQRTEDGY